jgi:Fe-S oxidoreductase
LRLLRDHTAGWRPPRLGGKAVAQTHCHQHAIIGYDADRALRRDAGVDLDVLDAGCCGLAGNFGFEAGHYDVSRACGERVLLPAVRDAAADTMVLAGGFSCRTQIESAGTGRTPCTWPRYRPPGCAASQYGRSAPYRRVPPTTPG